MPCRQPYNGNSVRVLVLDRRLAEQYKGDEPYVMVSIGNPSDTSAALLQYDSLRVAILRQVFSDTDDEPTMMSSAQALDIVNFALEHLYDCHMLVCHCEMGQSRSAAVAAAISHMVNEDDSFFFDNFTPNSHVYRTILNEYYRAVHNIEPYENEA